MGVMSAGNADRMACPELGWRGNANNLLYARPGCRHANRAVAIDSCVARRPPALKASTEDAAVERLSQLVLAVPDVSLAMLQQLLGALRHKQQQQQQQQQQQLQCRQVSLPGAVGLCSQLSIDSFRGSISGQALSWAGVGVDAAGLQASSSGGTAAAAASAAKTDPPCAGQDSQPQQTEAVTQAAAAAAVAGKPLTTGGQLQLPVLGHNKSCKTSLGGLRVQPGVQRTGFSEEAHFTQDEVARFLAGLRQCLDGVLQIKVCRGLSLAGREEWRAGFRAKLSAVVGLVRRRHHKHRSALRGAW
jgi:hypothetical protein